MIFRDFFAMLEAAFMGRGLIALSCKGDRDGLSRAHLETATVPCGSFTNAANYDSQPKNIEPAIATPPVYFQKGRCTALKRPGAARIPPNPDKKKGPVGPKSLP